MESTRRAAIAASAVVIALTACSPATTTWRAPEADAVPSAEAIDGLFDVGGHSLFLKCEGSGAPTILYLHGAIPEKQSAPHLNGLHLQSVMKDDYRFCVYDRRNLDPSDTVPNDYQDAEDVIADLRGLLDAAGIEPPFALLGASFGGLIGYIYANEYPDEVVAMVQLDSPFPDEMTLEHLFPYEDRYEAYVEEDRSSLEQINHYAVLMRATEFIGKEPAIPLTYFASTPDARDNNDWGVPEYDEQILGLQSAYIDRFAPGVEVWVDAPHFMEPAIPDQIGRALRDVIARSAN